MQFEAGWQYGAQLQQAAVTRPRRASKPAIDSVASRDDVEQRWHHFVRLDKARGGLAAHQSALLGHARCIGAGAGIDDGIVISRFPDLLDHLVAVSSAALEAP